MTEGAGGDGGAGGGAPAGGTPAAGAAAIAGGDGGGGGGGAAASWRDSLPETLRADASLANFADVSALAQGYLDTKKTATMRLPDFKSEDGLKFFADTVRPAEATEYEIPVPEGQGSELADKFRAFAHERGMPAAWVKDLAEFNNQQVAETLAAENAKSQAEVDTLKREMGDGKFDAAMESIRKMLPQMGVQLSEAEMDTLDIKLGSANLIRFLSEAAARIGDPAPLDGGELSGGGTGLPGAMTPAQAQERWNTVQKNPDWRKQAQVEGTPEHKEYLRLNSLIAAGRRQQQKPA